MKFKWPQLKIGIAVSIVIFLTIIAIASYLLTDSFETKQKRQSLLQEIDKKSTSGDFVGAIALAETGKTLLDKSQYAQTISNLRGTLQIFCDTYASKELALAIKYSNEELIVSTLDKCADVNKYLANSVAFTEGQMKALKKHLLAGSVITPEKLKRIFKVYFRVPDIQFSKNITFNIADRKYTLDIEKTASGNNYFIRRVEYANNSVQEINIANNYLFEGYPHWGKKSISVGNDASYATDLFDMSEINTSIATDNDNDYTLINGYQFGKNQINLTLRRKSKTEPFYVSEIGVGASGNHKEFRSSPANDAPIDCYAFSKYVEARGHGWLATLAMVNDAKESGKCAYKP